jgi:transposase
MFSSRLAWRLEMKAYSLDLRTRVLALCDGGKGTHEVSKILGVSESWIRRVKQRRREEGRVGVRPSGGRRHGHFDAVRLSQLEEWVRQCPDATLEALRARVADQMELRCSLMAVCRALKKIGWSLKKTLRASERDRPDVQRQRANFLIARRFASPESFVFLDESGAQTNMTRLYGRAPVGHRCFFAAPHGHWRTTTLLSAIRTTGVIKDASIVFDGPTNAMIFRSYVEECLAPALQEGDIVVMDNLASHKVVGVREAIEEAGANTWYLPPYSPDLNPIEKLWAKVKAWLRRIAARSIDALIEGVGDVLRAVDADECRAYLRSSGYATDER